MTIFENVERILNQLEDTPEGREVLQKLAISGEASHELADEVRRRIVRITSETGGMFGQIGNLRSNVEEDGSPPLNNTDPNRINTLDSLTDQSADRLRQLAITRLIEFSLRKQLNFPHPPPFLRVLANNPSTLPPLLVSSAAQASTAEQFKRLLNTHAAALGVSREQLACLNDPELLDKIRKTAVETLITSNILAVGQGTVSGLDELAAVGVDREAYNGVRNAIFRSGSIYGDFSAIRETDQAATLPNENNPTWKLKLQAVAMKVFVESTSIPNATLRQLMIAASRDHLTAFSLCYFAEAFRDKNPEFSNIDNIDKMTPGIFSQIVEGHDGEIIKQRTRAAMALVNRGVDEGSVLEILGKIHYQAQADAVIALANGASVDFNKITQIIVDMGVAAREAATEAAAQQAASLSRSGPSAPLSPTPFPGADLDVLARAHAAVAEARANGGLENSNDRAVIDAAGRAARAVGEGLLEALKILVEQELLISSDHVTRRILELIVKVEGEPGADKAKIIWTLLSDISGDEWQELLELFVRAQANSQTEVLAEALKNIPAGSNECQEKRKWICHIAQGIKNRGADATPADITLEVIEAFWKLGQAERGQVRDQFVQLPPEQRAVDVARAVDHLTRVDNNANKLAIIHKLAEAGVKKGFEDGGLSADVVNALYAAAGGDAAFNISTIDHVITALAILSSDHTDKQKLDVVQRLINFKDDEPACKVIAHLLKGGMPLGEINDDLINKIKGVPENDLNAVAEAVAQNADEQASAVVWKFVNAGFTAKGYLDKRIIDAISKIADEANRNAIMAYFLDRDDKKFGVSAISRLKAAIVLAKIKTPTLKILEGIKAAQPIVIQKVSEDQRMLSNERPSAEFIENYQTKAMHTNEAGDDLKVEEMTTTLPKGRRMQGYRSRLKDGLETEISEYTVDTETAHAGSIQIEPPILTGGKLTAETAWALAEYMAKRAWKSINIGNIDLTVMTDVYVEGEVCQVPFKTLVYLAATAQDILVRDNTAPLPGRSEENKMIEYLEEVGNAPAEGLVKDLFHETTSMRFSP